MTIVSLHKLYTSKPILALLICVQLSVEKVLVNSSSLGHLELGINLKIKFQKLKVLRDLISSPFLANSHGMSVYVRAIAQTIFIFTQIVAHANTCSSTAIMVQVWENRSTIT